MHIILCVIVIFCIVLKETNFFSKNKNKEGVEKEREFGVEIDVEGVKLFKGKKELLKDLSLTVAKNEVYALIGTNGAGKSHLFKTIIDDEWVGEGNVWLQGTEIKNERDRSKIKHRIGFCPQNTTAFKGLSAKSHLKFFAWLKGIKPKRMARHIEWIVKKTGLERDVGKTVSKLSGGNQRKLQVAIALIGLPPLLLLDEPTTNMDPFSRQQIQKLLSEVSQDYELSTVLLTTQLFSEAEAVANKIGVLMNGRIKFEGSPSQLSALNSLGFCVEVKLKYPAIEAIEHWENRVVDSLDVDSVNIQIKDILPIT